MAILNFANKLKLPTTIHDIFKFMFAVSYFWIQSWSFLLPSSSFPTQKRVRFFIRFLLQFYLQIKRDTIIYIWGGHTCVHQKPCSSNHRISSKMFKSVENWGFLWRPFLQMIWSGQQMSSLVLWWDGLYIVASSKMKGSKKWVGGILNCSLQQGSY